MGLALALVLAILVCRRAGARPPRRPCPGRLLVGFKKGVSTERQQQHPGGASAGDLAALQVDPRRPARGRAPALRARRPTPCASGSPRTASVAYAEPDFFLSPQDKTPDDPFYPLQYALIDSPERPRHRRPGAPGTRAPAAPRSRSSTPGSTPTIPTSKATSTRARTSRTTARTTTRTATSTTPTAGT